MNLAVPVGIISHRSSVTAPEFLTKSPASSTAFTAALRSQASYDRNSCRRRYPGPECRAQRVDARTQMAIADGLTDVELIDLHAVQLVSLHRHSRSLTILDWIFARESHVLKSGLATTTQGRRAR
jgi:hypothetical protein